MTDNEIKGGAPECRCAPVRVVGLLNKDSVIVRAGSKTSYPFLQIALMHDVPYSWVLQFADRLKYAYDEELPHQITWEGWQMETHLAMRSIERKAEEASNA